MLKNIKYNIKKAIPMAMMALAPLANSCDKGEDPVKEPYDVTITYHIDNLEVLLDFPTIQKYVADDQVRTIYFEVVDSPNPPSMGEWWGATMENPVKNAIKPAFDAAEPKGRGKGTFKDVTSIQDATKKWLESKGYKVEMSKIMPEKQR